MSVRKYLLSGAIWAALFGLFGPLRRSKKEPFGAGVVLAWAGWLIALVAAIITVRQESAEVSEYYELRDAERSAKRR